MKSKYLTNNVKVGIFVMAMILIIGYIGLQFGTFAIGGKYYLYASFPDAVGIVPLSSVQIYGVTVGKVEDLRVKDNQAWMKLSIDRGIELHNDAGVTIKMKTLLGEKYVQMIPGTAGLPLLKNGDTIVNVSPSYDVNILLNQFGEVTAKLAPLLDKLMPSLDQMADLMPQILDGVKDLNGAFGDGEGQIDMRRFVQNLVQLTEGMDNFFNRHEAELGAILKGMAEVAPNAKPLMSDTAVVMKKARGIAEKNSDDIEVLIPAFRDLVINLDTFVKHADKVLNEADTPENRERLKNLIGQLDKVLDQLHRSWLLPREKKP